MRDIIFTFFNYFVFFYTSMLAISFIVFAFLSFISLKRRKDYYVESYVRKIIKESPYTPGVSVIAPAYNEEKTIIDNINSMLALEYPVFEVIIVNDGSTDKTLEKILFPLQRSHNRFLLFSVFQHVPYRGQQRQYA